MNIPLIDNQRDLKEALIRIKDDAFNHDLNNSCIEYLKKAIDSIEEKKKMCELNVLSVKKKFYEDLVIEVEFEKNGQKAKFEYTLIGRERGIDRCTYTENDDEDIYAEIHEWVSEHITVNLEVFYDDKKIKNMLHIGELICIEKK